MSKQIPGDAGGAGAYANTVTSAVPIVGVGGQNEISPLCISLVVQERALDVGPLVGPTTKRANGKAIGKDGKPSGRRSLHIDLPR